MENNEIPLLAALIPDEIRFTPPCTCTDKKREDIHFQKACEKHDLCWGQACNKQEAEVCDRSFKDDLTEECKKGIPDSEDADELTCKILVDTYTTVVSQARDTIFSFPMEKNNTRCQTTYRRKGGDLRG